MVYHLKKKNHQTTKKMDTMKKLATFVVFALLNVFSVNAQTEWNFGVIPAADQENMNTDAVLWKNNEASFRYENTVKNTPKKEPLMANGQELEMTKGLLFDGVTKSNRIRLSYKDKNQVLILSEAGFSITIPDLKKGQKIEVVAKPASSGTTAGLSATNLDAEEGSFGEITAKSTHNGTVKEDGEVTLTTETNGVGFCTIKVTEGTNGITEIKTDAQAQGKWFTIDGKRISKPTTGGLYICNGKKIAM